jgi:hypothetical protein
MPICAVIKVYSSRKPYSGSFGNSLTMCDLVSHDRPGREPVPQPRPPGVVSAVASAGRTDTFPRPALPAAGPPARQAQGPGRSRRSILVIAWHLLSDRDSRFHDLGAHCYASRIDKNLKTRIHVRQIRDSGYTVVLTPAA